MSIKGIKLDTAGRCIHYHKENDIVGIKCGKCQKYYACYKCHDELEDHLFVPISMNDTSPVICGNCQHKLNYKEYQSGHCPYCKHLFNPKCQKHADNYFCS